MQCRSHCGACCIAPSISSVMPGLPMGKAAGQACIHLTEDKLCKLFNQSVRPEVCKKLEAHREMCRDSAEQALAYLRELEQITS